MNTVFDKKPTMLNMTGEEFKRLVEQQNPNGQVDTMPELMKMFNGIGDDETIAEYVARVAVTAESLPWDSVGMKQLREEILSVDSDIDELFDGDPLIYEEEPAEEETEGDTNEDRR